MPKNLTTSQKTAIAQTEVKTRNLLTFPVNDISTVRILENDTTTSLTISGVQYLAAMVKRGEVKTSSDTNVEKITITLSNIWQEFSSAIANAGDTITNQTCNVFEVIYDVATNTIIGTPILLFSGKINNIKCNIATIEFDVERSTGGYSTVSPNATYDVSCQVKKFKDSRCGYTGSETKCDNTLTRCKKLNNSTRFYGFPTITQEMAPIVTGKQIGRAHV